MDIGHALFAAQEGKTDPAAKPLKGFGGASVLEIVASHHGNAWRAVYTVRFQDAIYVLHVFQKKSTKGIATPTREIELIKQRLAEAERDYRERGGTKMKIKAKKTRKNVARVTEGSGNVFADLGLPNPEQEMLKAQLTLQIYTILKGHGMTQVEIAKILGVQQPQVSLLMRNRAGNFSVGRLMEFLTALRQDVEITVRPTRKEHGAVSVFSA
jgi:phage-related protein/predicted XRE-type DNA-binding protein